MMGNDRRDERRALWILLATFILIGVGLVWMDGLTDRADAATVAKRPRCAIKNPGAPLIVKGDGKVGFTNQRYMVGEFLNQCLDPVFEIGSHACLLEYEFPMTDDSPAHVVECSANRERIPFTLIAPVQADLYILAKCSYTTIPRFYAIEGYGWAQSLPTDGAIKYVSKPKRSGLILSETHRSNTPIHYCHVDAPGTTWRSFKFR